MVHIKLNEMRTIFHQFDQLLVSKAKLSTHCRDTLIHMYLVPTYLIGNFHRITLDTRQLSQFSIFSNLICDFSKQMVCFCYNNLSCQFLIMIIFFFLEQGRNMKFFSYVKKWKPFCQIDIKYNFHFFLIQSKIWKNPSWRILHKQNSHIRIPWTFYSLSHFTKNNRQIRRQGVY